MHKRFYKPALMCIALAIFWSSSTQARRVGSGEAIFILPYVQSQTIDFEGGAKADINSDPGIGFGFAYNYSSKLAGRVDFLWNNVSYDATRIIDDADRTEEIVSGRLDTFNLLLGGEYYFLENELSPFVAAGIGWNYIDTNIPSGPPSNVCWWDPFWGYICSGYRPTYGSNEFSYNFGLGLRVPVGRSNFLKVGYYTSYSDLNNSTSSTSIDTFRFEFGFSY
jgi:hypothetical protein